MDEPLPQTNDPLPDDSPTGAHAGEAPSDSRMSQWRYRKEVLLHYAHVYRMAAAVLRDAAEAEDVTQETFVRFWKHGHTVEKPRPWLLKVAHNACLDRLRKADHTVLNENPHERVEPADERDPAWQYEQAELSEKLRGLIDGLPEPQRSLVLLFDVRGMSGALCAQILELSHNQVKVYLHRARRRLREQLENGA